MFAHFIHLAYDIHFTSPYTFNLIHSSQSFHFPVPRALYIPYFLGTPIVMCTMLAPCIFCDNFILV